MRIGLKNDFFGVADPSGDGSVVHALREQIGNAGRHTPFGGNYSSNVCLFIALDYPSATFGRADVADGCGRPDRSLDG